MDYTPNINTQGMRQPMVSTPGAANASNNVATSTLIKNCCGRNCRC